MNAYHALEVLVVLVVVAWSGRVVWRSLGPQIRTAIRGRASDKAGCEGCNNCALEAEKKGR